MLLSVIIANWNTRDLLAQSLESVSNELRALPAGEAEVLIVDNASTDGSVALVEERFPWVRLIANDENVGFARANNQALRLANGRFLLLLNSDTVIRSDAFSRLLRALERHSQAGAVGPQVLNPDGTIQNCFGSFPSVVSEVIGPFALDIFTKPWGRFGRNLQLGSAVADKCQVVDRVSFACTMIRREALEQVGLLDERFEFYSEDYDWFIRLHNAGWQTLFCPQAEILHYWGASSSQRSTWSLRQLYRSKRLYFAKHHGPASETMLRIGLASRFAVKWLLGALRYPLDRQVAVQQSSLYCLLGRDMLHRLLP